MAELLEPKEIEINGATFRISKFPAVAGREIITKYPVSNTPKLGDYKTSEEVMLKVMGYVERVGEGGVSLRLASRALVDNHVKDWETLVKLEWAMLEYNCSFFQNGKSLDFFKKLAALAKSSLSEILMTSLGKLSQAEKQPSTSSEPSTH